MNQLSHFGQISQTNPFVTLPLPPVPPENHLLIFLYSLIYSAMIRKIYQMAICF